MKMGERVMYKERAVYILQTPKPDAQFALIQDGGRQFRVPIVELAPLPEGAHITTQQKIGKGTVIPKEIRTQYVQHKVKTGSGKSYAIDNNDGVANSLRGVSLEDAYTAAVSSLADHGVETSVAALKAKYENLNPGMQRMNLGNLIRGAAKKADTQARKDQAKAEKEAAKAELQAKKDAVKAQRAADAQAKKDAKAAAAAAKAQADADAEAVVAPADMASAAVAGPADATPVPTPARRTRARKTAAVEA